MPRGRQYYDPEIQANRPSSPLPICARIEFYPDQDRQMVRPPDRP